MVVCKELGIANSYTLEASLCGAPLGLSEGEGGRERQTEREKGREGQKDRVRVGEGGKEGRRESGRERQRVCESRW